MSIKTHEMPMDVRGASLEEDSSDKGSFVGVKGSQGLYDRGDLANSADLKS